MYQKKFTQTIHQYIDLLDCARSHPVNRACPMVTFPIVLTLTCTPTVAFVLTLTRSLTSTFALTSTIHASLDIHADLDLCPAHAADLDPCAAAGRASAAPSTDLFITLLSLGVAGYRALLRERRRLFDRLRARMTACAEKHAERMLSTPHNHISMGEWRRLAGRLAGRIGS